MSQPTYACGEATTELSPLTPLLPARRGEHVRWGKLHGSAFALALSAAARQCPNLVFVIAENTRSAYRLDAELRFYLADTDLAVLSFPDWETLPYDHFSPHQDIISQRLSALFQLPKLVRGVLVVPLSTLLQRLAPASYVHAHSLVLECGERLDAEHMRRCFDEAGYRRVAQVMEHGEYAVRGALIDIYPMGSAVPYRLDLFDDRIDGIRTFDAETQRTCENLERIRLLPAHEFPFNDEARARFRTAWRAHFAGEAQRSPIYRDISQGLAPPGIEYYLPLFFAQTQTLFDYLPANTLIVREAGVEEAALHFWAQINTRYEQGRHDIERPLLEPEKLFLSPEAVEAAITAFAHISAQHHELPAPAAGMANYATAVPPDLTHDARRAPSGSALRAFLTGYNGRVLFAAESLGRREVLLDMLRADGLYPASFPSWHAFNAADAALGITVFALEQGLLLLKPAVTVIAESQLFRVRAAQNRRRKSLRRDADAIVRNLTELDVGAPVVHEDHGVGRYQGLQLLTVDALELEFVVIEYSGGDKLYVPVSSLHLISRYTGADPEHAPLHKLGSDQWQRARRKAAEQARDVAAELLDLYARRAARQGHAFIVDSDDYAAFAAAFPFEETQDQQSAIDNVLADMSTGRPMDRVVCGDVGFGKTEVAMRAAFIATQGNRQVAVLVPTTLLAQQHYQNFRDRFAEWPLRVEVISRFNSKGQQQRILDDLVEGQVDILIGTHKLLRPEVRFKNLGLVILDEEHRFGVRQKERLKALRAEVDILTLTATPIPRTLNMALANLRDLSLIVTAPAHRHAIKTFVSEYNKTLVREACLREIQRGGQVYYLHNDVATIARAARELQECVPEASVRIAHGQMRERELEQVMLDFYHRRFNVLVCTTIIESGIDVPSANTILIQRADKLGLAQLHQIRGRVGRSHHRAYAYLFVPPRTLMTADAIKRLEAIESLEDLGAGFTLATHDLEIRGAGELLGEEQSGQIHEVGFTLYSELLERAVKSLQAGQEPQWDQPLEHGPEINLHAAALIPQNYLPDIHTRLIFYKRIANAANAEELRDLQVEMIDRFGLLPEPLLLLFNITELKLQALPLGIHKIEAGEQGGRIVFGTQPAIDSAKLLHLIHVQPQIYRLDGANKLRFTLNLVDVKARLLALKKLLDTLTINAPA